MPEILNFTLASHDEVAAALGARLKTLRLAQGLQQAELATRAGVSRYIVQELEASGKCTLMALLRITRALGRTSDLQDLFQIRVNSIAQMEQAQAPRRIRAPRKNTRTSVTPTPTDKT